MGEKGFSRVMPLAAVILTLFLIGCAGQTVSFTVPAGAAETTVALEASSFRFAPNAIEAHAGDRLLMRVHNVAGIGHNLTVEDPGGRVVLALDLPAGKTTEGRLALEQAGEYRFFCDKPLHGSMGMSGTITGR